MVSTVAFTINNRPDYIRETFDYWSRVRGIDKARVIFMCEPGCPEAVDLCESVDWAGTVTVVVNAERQGALGNPYRALEFGFVQRASDNMGGIPGDSDFVVLAEEDSPVAADTLEYFEWSSETFLHAPNVLAVCAFRRWQGEGGKAAVQVLPYFSPTVWGVWRGRWKLLREDWDFDYTHKGWDWRISERWVRDSYWRCAFPADSRSQVSGEFGGTHLQPGQQYQEHLSDCFTPDIPPQHYELT